MQSFKWKKKPIGFVLSSNFMSKHEQLSFILWLQINTKFFFFFQTSQSIFYPNFALNRFEMIYRGVQIQIKLSLWNSTLSSCHI